MSKIFELAEALIEEYKVATAGLTTATNKLNDINHEAGLSGFSGVWGDV